MSPKLLESQYKDHLSEFHAWHEAHPSCEEYLVFPENMGTALALDETSLQGGELFTILTNKEAHGKKGSLVALIKGTKSATITSVLNLIPVSLRMQVREVTIDMANTMDWVCRSSFMNATHTIDRFHVQKTITEGLQEIRIRLRREARAEEETQLLCAKQEKRKYKPPTLSNGDTLPQLLARSRYLLFKNAGSWTATQKKRAALLFEKYPLLQKAYGLSCSFRSFYHTTTRTSAESALRTWYEKVDREKIPEMSAAALTVRAHEGRILNYFEHRSTNAAAESFNAKIKGFRALLRGIRDLPFFLYRLQHLFA